MICYAVIDTNVLVSALISNHADTATVQLVGRLIGGESKFSGGNQKSKVQLSKCFYMHVL